MSTQAWQQKMKALKQTFTLEELCKLLGVESYDGELNDGGWTYNACYDEAIKEGKTKEEAEELALKAEWSAASEAYNEYKGAILFVAEKLFAEHELQIVEVKGGCKVYPTETWEKAADCIRMTINGVGMFEFSTVSDFLESGPYTARRAVLSHLGWIRDWPRVYEGSTVSTMVERRMR